MSTAPDWLRWDAIAGPRTPRQKIRNASAGALLLYAALLVTLLAVLWALFSFVVAVQARSALRGALEQAAVDALPPGVRLGERGVFAEGDATGYASASSPLPPAQVLASLAPRGGSRWQPIPGTATDTGRAWASTSQKYILTIDATPCSSDQAPVGCPAGGSALRVQVAPGGPRS